MRRVAPLVLLLVAGAAACGDGGELTIDMATSQTSTTFVTLPIPSTTVPPATNAPANGDDAEDTGEGTGDADEEPQDPDAERSYTVQSGDFLAGIAREFDVTATDIVAYNGWEGLDHLILRGDVIRIPPVNWEPDAGSPDDSGVDAPQVSEAAAETGEACDDGSSAETYELQSGDTPGRVAARFDTTVEDLEAANADTPNYANFVVGTVIKLPCP